MEPLNKSRTFPLTLNYDGEYYGGDITPSAETAREQEGNSTGLVQAIAGYIRSYYL